MIHVLGLGIDSTPLGLEATHILEQSQVIAGASSLLDQMHIPAHKRLPLTTLDEFAAQIRALAQNQQVCVLAHGDPLLYGLGSSLLKFFKPEELVFHPHISALQSACACFGLPWHDLAIISVHGRTNLAPLFAALTRTKLVGVFTDPKHSPAYLAQSLLDRQVQGWRMHVAENLGTPQKRCTTWTLKDVLGQDFAMNIVILERTEKPDQELCPGVDEKLLEHADGLITKRAVRVLALSLLRLSRISVLWDLGAGSGAMSIDAAFCLTHGQIVAVEGKLERVAQIQNNLQRFGAWNVQVVHNTLARFLATPPKLAPTHVFVGGGATPETINQVCHYLGPGGRLVITAILFSTLEKTKNTLKTLGWPVTIHQIMHHQSAPLGKDLRLVPQNPVFILETQKPDPNS